MKPHLWLKWFQKILFMRVGSMSERKLGREDDRITNTESTSLMGYFILVHILDSGLFVGIRRLFK